MEVTIGRICKFVLNLGAIGAYLPDISWAYLRCHITVVSWLIITTLHKCNPFPLYFYVLRNQSGLGTNMEVTMRCMSQVCKLALKLGAIGAYLTDFAILWAYLQCHITVVSCLKITTLHKCKPFPLYFYV